MSQLEHDPLGYNLLKLSMPLPLGKISLAININRKLVTINAKSTGMILNLFIKTGNDNSLSVNSTRSLYIN